MSKQFCATRSSLTNEERLYAAICRQALQDAKSREAYAEEAEAFLLRELLHAQPLLLKELGYDTRAIAT